MIRVILVDDELPALGEMEYLLGKYSQVEVIGKYQTAQEALEKAAAQPADAAFVDIGLPGMNGLELAVKLQELSPGIFIIFVTAYSDYALEAFKTYPLDYIMKPVDEQHFARMMARLSEQYSFRRLLVKGSPKTIIRCFGNYEVYSENGEKRYMKFATRQVKEMFAYLIDRFEKPVPRAELMENIFGGAEDPKTVNLLHVTAYKLRNALENIAASRSSITIRGNYTLEAADGVCDYIDFVRFCAKNPLVDKDNIAQAEMIAGLYRGTYLENEDYLWAEQTRAALEIAHEGLLLRMADYYAEHKKMQKSEKTLLTLLGFNTISEEGNSGLLDLYRKTDNKEKFRRQYETYREALGELGEKPRPEFTSFYLSCL